MKAEALLRRAVASDPSGIGPRLVLARRLLNTGREPEAMEHLVVLDRA